MLNQTQRTTLKAFIEANPTLSVLAMDGNMGGLADALNTAAAPTFTVWRSRIPASEYRNVIVWTEVDALQAGDARTWEWITENMTAPINAASSNVRTGIADVWASNSATRPALLGIAKRAATVLEKLFATGTGSVADPAAAAVEGVISWQEVSQALAGE